MGFRGAILLAAGASTRMGAIKQLLPWKNSTLLEHAIEQLQGSELDFLVVVLGANEKEIRREVSFKGADVVVNPDWAKGMASSIAKGLRFLLEKEPELQSVLVALSDQPLLDSNQYKSLVNKLVNDNLKIVASVYSGQPGVPAVFDKDYFENLIDLKGHSGARVLLRQGSAEVGQIKVDQRAVDLDTADEYNRIYDLYGRL